MTGGFVELPEYRAWVQSKFERVQEDFTVTSPCTDAYNCIAWATGDDSKWWWPDQYGIAYWPKGQPRAETVEAFVSAYGSVGFLVCDVDEIHPDYDCLVIYVDAGGVPTHASRSLPAGDWTSKLGEGFDISHATPESLMGIQYGTPKVFMRRPRVIG